MIELVHHVVCEFYNRIELSQLENVLIIINADFEDREKHLILLHVDV